ncbi:MAG TPA: polysaccharide deacetylase family protein [Myxococcota bacterium]|nr:polysaccharide deacetylase family protein [Myxococcota bacterium]
MDLEIASDHDLEAQSRVLERLHGDLERLGLPVTIFTTAEAARAFALPLLKLCGAGHEIGCHGRNHAPGENFARMSLAEARRALAAATSEIRLVTGSAPASFRGPWMATSAATQRALLELGYRCDFSPCPQRLDFFRTRGGTVRWLGAPRGPYHPAPDSPFRRGSSPLLVVPLSCIGVPFISGLLYLAGAAAVQGLFRALCSEARWTARPVVYLFHSYEFCPASSAPDRRPWLQHRYSGDREQRYRRHLELLEAMLSTPGVEPLVAQSLLERSW